MIVLTKENNIEIPNYDDLENKPSINGVVLEGNKTTEELNIEGDLYDLGQGMKFESGTSVTRDVDSEFYFNTLNSIHDNKILIAIVDDVVKVFNLITENNRYLMFGSSVAESEGVLIDYITLTKVFSDVNTTSIIGFKLSYQSEYYSYNANVDLTGYATEQWVEDKGYLTSVPSEYVTETELNEAIDNLEMQNIPYVVFGTPSTGNKPTILAGNAEDVLYASIRKEPHFAYVYNGSINDYGASGELTQLTVSSGFIGRQFEAFKYDALNNEIVIILVLVTPDVANGGYIYAISNYRYKTATHSWVEAYYQKKGNYLTSIPSEYVTDDELNEAIVGLGGTDIPTVVISNGDANSTTPRVTGGDLDAVINAISTNAPYIAYFVNVGTKYGVSGKKYLIQAADFNSVNNTGALYYHTEIDGGNHMDVQIFFRKENDAYTVFNITRQYHYYQEQLTSGVNIKTINGQSVLGSGDLTIEGGGTTDLSEYVTETELNNTLDDYYTKDIADRYFAPKGQVIEYVEVYEGGNYLEARNEQGHCGLYLNVGDVSTNKAGLVDAQSLRTYMDGKLGNINTILENIIG